MNDGHRALFAHAYIFHFGALVLTVWFVYLSGIGAELNPIFALGPAIFFGYTIFGFIALTLVCWFGSPHLEPRFPWWPTLAFAILAGMCLFDLSHDIGVVLMS